MYFDKNKKYRLGQFEIISKCHTVVSKKRIISANLEIFSVIALHLAFFSV